MFKFYSRKHTFMDNALPTVKYVLLQFFGDVEIDFSLAKLCLSDNENITEDLFFSTLDGDLAEENC